MSPICQSRRKDQLFQELDRKSRDNPNNQRISIFKANIVIEFNENNRDKLDNEEISVSLSPAFQPSEYAHWIKTFFDSHRRDHQFHNYVCECELWHLVTQIVSDWIPGMIIEWYTSFTSEYLGFHVIHKSAQKPVSRSGRLGEKCNLHVRDRTLSRKIARRYRRLHKNIKSTINQCSAMSMSIWSDVNG